MAARAGRNDVDRVRTAIIGAGAMGRQHAQWLAPIPEAQVVAIVDPHIPSAHKLAASAEAGTQVFAEVEPMLAAVAPEYVIVASPPRFHAEQSIAAFSAGAHVLCEKPLCMSVAEGQAMEMAAHKAGRLFTVGLQMRQSPAEQAVHRFLSDGGLGDIYHTRVWGGHIMSYPWGRYFHRADMSLGGVIAATTVHPLDAVYWLLGAPEIATVSASTFRRIDKMPDPPVHFEGEVSEVTVEDFAHAHVRLAGGSSLSIEGNWLQHPRDRPHGWEIHGTLGVVQDVAPHVALDRQQEVTPVELDMGAEPESRTMAEHIAFIDAIRGRSEPAVSWREALGVQRLLNAIYDSAQAGVEVRL
ncbi:MAG: Gfo/Idh/MocA family oxidoreductase [Gemmatimonadetes bacterium]|jgi:predicted dehydrogenase|nr:Gfo/Idh/MocA family oxidoreductase [Gemmatimonadota bacterium]